MDFFNRKAIIKLLIFATIINETTVKQVSPELYCCRQWQKMNYGKLLFFAHRQQIKNNPEIRNILRKVFNFSSF